MTEIWLPLLGGLVLLVLGGEFLVRGAVQVAERLGVSPLVIGLTLVGFGTSMPELVTSVQAALAGSPGIAFGNIVGSNIANILLIVGASSLILPIAVASSALRRDAIVMLGTVAIFTAISFVMPMGRVVGAVFLAALITYIVLAIRQERSASDHGAVFDKEVALEGVDPGLKPTEARSGKVVFSVLIAVAGLALVIFGGKFLVDGAVSLARSFGITETVIGLTVVALGTSMPELVTSVVAAFKKQSDIAFGNIVGSNIYNILGIGGTTALIAPSAVPTEIVTFDNLVMLAVTGLLVLFAATGLRIARWEGGVLLAGYFGYIAILWP
ncbi:sodium:calcium antiporter [Oceanicola sp. 22II-s10i]|uniref:calcium/sodium antiporter n=1 Tax=Oceanicola sp. 22II-s10i TaxID=1317116 RepID=UPI000B52753A|nr:calcium/sodium antiporter [Oceanicola sp. 22II-s10i]OWU83796.1 sodium:calcium antiporter [Oceanicola sp. 22II-s10i]